MMRSFTLSSGTIAILNKNNTGKNACATDRSLTVAALSETPVLDACQHRLLNPLDRRFVALVKGPLLQALPADKSCAAQDIQMLTSRRLTHSQLARDQQPANSILHQ